MQTQIENLVKLQAVEVERGKLLQAAKALPAEIARAQAALEGAQGQASSASDALNREDSLRTKLEREIDGHRQKAARYKALGLEEIAKVTDEDDRKPIQADLDSLPV